MEICVCGVDSTLKLKSKITVANNDLKYRRFFTDGTGCQKTKPPENGKCIPTLQTMQGSNKENASPKKKKKERYG